MIAIIDYGLGNIKAFANIYASLNIPFCIVKNSHELKKAKKIILPGVGSFDYAMRSLEESGMKEVLVDMVQGEHIPVMGICVGMQMMASSSQEGNRQGLGWIEGEVEKFDLSELKETFCIPHMGWNNINPLDGNGLMKGLDSHSEFYFLHSYYFKCEHKGSILATTDYGIEFACAIAHENVYGVQFHPEKSHGCGVRILENFARL